MLVEEDLLELIPGPHPGHFYDIQHRRDAGESSGSDGPVPVRTIRHELDIGDGVDDRGREADEGSVAGIGDRDVVPEEKKVRWVPATLNYGNDEGHGETDTPEGHGPVTYGPSQTAHVGHKREGHASGAELWQAEEAAHVELGVTTWGCRPGGHGVVTFRQVMVTSTAVVFPKDPPEKDPVPEVD